MIAMTLARLVLLNHAMNWAAEKAVTMKLTPPPRPLVKYLVTSASFLIRPLPMPNATPVLTKKKNRIGMTLLSSGDLGIRVCVCFWIAQQTGFRNDKNR